MEEKIKSTQENEQNIADITPKKKKQIAAKIISLLTYFIITVLALPFEIWTVVESVSIIAQPEVGPEGLAFIVLIPMLLITPIAAAVLYIIPFATSLVGFIASFKKTKKGAKRGGRIFFSIVLALTIITSVLIIVASVATILAIKIVNG